MNKNDINDLENLIKDEYENISGIVVLENGVNVYEKYFNGYTSNDAVHIFSATKSIISILLGIALDRGYIRSIDQRILEFFPDYKLKRGEKTLPEVTLRDMLTMTVPYKYKTNPYTKYFTSDDWVKSSLDYVGGKNGNIGDFRYAPIVGPDIFSGILKATTGQSVREFANDNLFRLLGFSIDNDVIFKDKEDQLSWYRKPKYERGWVADPKKVNTGGWGLLITVPDMAKLGQLYLNDGVWDDSRIVSSEWIRQCTTEHSCWTELNLHYGYLWWIIDKKEHSFAALGDSGNVIYVNPYKSMVVAIGSSFKPRVLDRIDFIKSYIEPLFGIE